MPYLLNRRHAVIAVLALAGCTEAQPAITPREAHERAARGELVLVDIRTPEEWRETGLAEHALPIDMNDRAFIDKLKAARAAKGGAGQDRPVALICRTANRSRAVQDALLKAGYTAIIDVKGGMAGNLTTKGWIAEGLPVKRLP
ncbi:MAG: rhodanese-like domain-containing protein [Beijerinckiaceae bacterium]